MTARRRPSSYRPLPSRSAAAWLWIDALTKLHPITLLFVACLAAIVVLVVIAWWPIFLAAAVCLLAWRVYLRHVERSRARGTIPYATGRLGAAEWLACRLIEVGERILRNRNQRRR